jgi:hypothetical protein
MCNPMLPRIVLPICIILAAVCGPSIAARAEENQVLELRTYTLVDSAAEKKLDDYLRQALLPALQRQGLGPIGVFGQASKPEDDSIKVMLLIPGADVESVTSATTKLSTDEEYKKTAEGYLNTPAGEPIVKRIQSELLLSFDSWPKVVVPKQKKQNSPRLFELRTYESPTEKLGQLKVEMFNSGEVPIFLDSGIVPVFMGQALIGDKMPNLTYMTVYDGEPEREAAWKKFLKHPDWLTLREVEKYKGTVSKIHKSDWRPKPYSQL